MASLVSIETRDPDALVGVEFCDRDLAERHSGSARVWRIGNFRFGFAAAGKQFKQF